MSGGSLDYLCYRVGEVAEKLQSKKYTPLVRAFAEHLVLVAGALHDIEWVLSSDYGEGDEEKAILLAMPNAKEKTVEVLKKDALDIIAQLQAMIDNPDKPLNS